MILKRLAQTKGMHVNVWLVFLRGQSLAPCCFYYHTTSLSAIIRKHQGVGFHFYADDTQLYVQDVKQWVSAKKPKQNAEKKENL